MGNGKWEMVVDSVCACVWWLWRVMWWCAIMGDKLPCRWLVWSLRLLRVCSHAGKTLERSITYPIRLEWYGHIRSFDGWSISFPGRDGRVGRAGNISQTGDQGDTAVDNEIYAAPIPVGNTTSREDTKRGHSNSIGVSIGKANTYRHTLKTRTRAHTHTNHMTHGTRHKV